MFKRVQITSVTAALVMVLSGCAHQSAITVDRDNLAVPESWSQATKLSLSPENKDWLKDITNGAVQLAIEQALQHNHGLMQQQLALQALEQSAKASGASLWPSLNLSFSNSRREQPSAISTSHELSLSLSFELDLWGKLSASDRQVNMQLASQKAQYQQYKQDLIADVVLAWFELVEANQQLALTQKRYDNTKQNLAIIESGYELGLNAALDVYLSRNEVATEQSRLANQKTTYEAAVRNLELLLGDHPSGNLIIEHNIIPAIEGSLNAGVPSEVVANKPALSASWLALLAKDAGLAYAHKQRFPSISLTAGLGTSSSELGDLLTVDPNWSLVGNLTQPLFNAGRLKANEEKARFETLQAEQAYLAEVKAAFALVENALVKEQNLRISYQAYQTAAENAELAQQLSFEQYLKGLVTYTTVLDSQTRAFNAESSLIQAKYQLLANRIQLHLALGGDFNSIISNGSTGL